MAEVLKLTRIPSLKTAADFRNFVASLGIDLPCEDNIAVGKDSPLAQPIDFEQDRLARAAGKHEVGMERMHAMRLFDRRRRSRK